MDMLTKKEIRKEKLAFPPDSKKILLGIEILQNCRNELYSFFPYLDAAFASVTYGYQKDIFSIATDGDTFFFSPPFLLKTYVQNAAVIKRGYLHMLLHCLYFHPFTKAPQLPVDQKLWNLACDIAVEQLIEQEQIPALTLPPDNIRSLTFRQLGHHACSAQSIFHMLKQNRFSSTIEQLSTAFTFDDHTIWTRQDDLSLAKARAKWEKIQAYTGQNKQMHRQTRGSMWGEEEDVIEPAHKSRYDYRKFLKKFSVPREEVELDMESFDYIFYNYGMEYYKNMPLIEPLEYKEVNRLEELVIAIDTSSSCTKEIVSQFLSETYAILSQRENFFHKMNVYLIQCDCYIQDVVVIHTEEEWKNYNRSIKIQGRGGTDFRPVFRYVEEQKAKKEIKNLKALIYFTDGDGIYPKVKPDYETAFVFLKKTDQMDKVPPWAIKLIAN